MNRATILAQYKISLGLIQSPGRFEGEMLYVPYYWDVYLLYGADRDNGRALGFDVSAEDKVEFPELKRRRTVKLIKSDQGFICEV